MLARGPSGAWMGVGAVTAAGWGPRCPGWTQGAQLSQSQPVQATFTHSSQSSLAMAPGWGEHRSAEPEPETSVVQGAAGHVTREGLLRSGPAGGALHPAHRIRAGNFRSRMSGLGPSPGPLFPRGAWPKFLNSLCLSFPAAEQIPASFSGSSGRVSPHCRPRRGHL